MGRQRRAQPKHLPEKLLAIRRRLGFSQAQMAEQFKDVPGPPYPGLISRFELGKAEPSLLVLLAYARLAKVSMETLVDDELDLPAKFKR
jgi:transcriptional regulator with XRE-family HTH domain